MVQIELDCENGHRWRHDPERRYRSESNELPKAQPERLPIRTLSAEGPQVVPCEYANKRQRGGHQSRNQETKVAVLEDEDISAGVLGR